jgi:hypothetical protein
MDHYTPFGRPLRCAARLLFAGVIISLIVGLFHPDGPANDHAAVFAEYAASAHWTAIHFGQFVGMLVIVAGLVVFFHALSSTPGVAVLTRRFGIATALLALGLYAVLQAVDGIALKQAVDAWVAAPDSEKVLRFASAETVRWLEWAVRSYFSLILGLAFLLLAAVIVRTRVVPRPIGYLAAGSGLTYFGQSWAVATQGFSPSNSAFIIAGIVLNVVWTAWLAILAMRVSASPTHVGSGAS